MKRGLKQLFSVAGVTLLAAGAFAATPSAKESPSVPDAKPGIPTIPKVTVPADDGTDGADPVPTEMEKPVNESPYAAIVERNIFALVPPPPLATNDVDVKSNTPPANVTLTGITTIFGNTRAYFLVQEMAQGGKPGEAPKSVMLTPGERQGGLEVLEINEKAATVKIKNDNVISTITFPKTAPSPGAPPPGGAPGGGPPGFQQGRRGNFGAPAGPGGAPGGAPLPNRNIRTGQGGGFSNQGGVNPYGGGQTYGGGGSTYQPQPIAYVNPGSTGNPASVALNSGAPGINTPGGANVPQQAQPPPLSPEEQTIMIEAQRAYAQQQHDQALPIILPPTEVSEGAGESGPPSFPK